LRPSGQRVLERNAECSRGTIKGLAIMTPMNRTDIRKSKRENTLSASLTPKEEEIQTSSRVPIEMSQFSPEEALEQKFMGHKKKLEQSTNSTNHMNLPVPPTPSNLHIDWAPGASSYRRSTSEHPGSSVRPSAHTPDRPKKPFKT